ncbi:MAG: TonB-dependent receptor [Betaproteobacteria bacterium]|nr:TonB-dependent receptor [Betaproteobacteria bacterium]
MPVFKLNKISRLLTMAGLLGSSGLVVAEEVDTASVLKMAPIVVTTGTRMEQNSFDLPMSINATSAEEIQEGQLKVNLSESAVRVPGVVVNNRNNPAQDLAIQIRGFGARSAFGVRGVRLYADGIPMTMPDGQGQTGTFNLDTANRVEYLRGPFSALYGNSSGGVVQIFTQDGTKEPTISSGATFGSYNTQRYNLGFSDSGDGFDYIVNANTYRSDGYRDQSDTSRDTLHGKINFKLGDDTKLTIVATALEQRNNEDPQGLDATQLRNNPKQAGTSSELFNTRVSRNHQQAGATLEHLFTPDDTLRLMAYYGQRSNEQFQSVTVGAQRNDLQGGGVATIDRDFGGADVRWVHKGLLGEMPYNFTVGMNYDRMEDDRKGYENFTSNRALGALPAGVNCGNVANAVVCGVKGNLRRNETNTAKNFDQYIQGAIDLSKRFTLSGGLRHSKVRFENDDKFMLNTAYTGVNPDDSGRVTFSETTPVIGAIFKVTDTLNLYANAGESFETPTFVEMAYRATGDGLNFDLKPAKSRQYEVGAKAMLGDSTLVNASVFKIDTDDEIVLQQQAGGRSVFQNIKSSERKGFELSLDSKFDNNLRAYLAYTYLDAEFSSDFMACRPFVGVNTACNINLPPAAGTPGNSGGEAIASGTDIPGTYKHTLYGELSWKYDPMGFSTALEGRAFSKTYVAFKPEYGKADGYAIASWRGGFTQNVNNWKFNEFVRIDNMFDKEYVGSVRIADLNGRYYEPAPGRTWLLGLNAAYKF